MFSLAGGKSLTEGGGVGVGGAQLLLLLQKGKDEEG